jgi:hypothetical protein
MLTFTLDTNCVIAVDEKRAEIEEIRELASAHSQERANVALVAMSASEKQKGGGYLNSFNSFERKVKELDLDHLGLVYPMCYNDISFSDACLVSDGPMAALEYEIHQVLFPNIEFDYFDFCASRGFQPGFDFSGESVKWRNAKCDVQALWSHINAKRDVFVTSDGDFHKASRKPNLIALGAGRIEYPKAAATLLL